MIQKLKNSSFNRKTSQILGPVRSGWGLRDKENWGSPGHIHPEYSERGGSFSLSILR
jgi:hypothetical protein